MGEPTPDDWPEILDDKWYCVTVDAFQDVGPFDDCRQDFSAQLTCCRQGVHINNWINNELECIGGFELCVFTGFSAQRLLDLKGPYDTQALCNADCP
ncbi:MAG: hypothetical protein HWN68_16705 [Desulfobacterales bacterium]|nr:hypothetical protein [Desulfobacterales bacterium]